MATFNGLLRSMSSLGHLLVSTLLEFQKRCGLPGTRLMVMCYVVVAVLIEQQAWAGCGDYLHGATGNRAAAVTHPARPLNSLDPFRLPACSGPECHRRDSLPVVPVEVPTTVVADDAILLCEDLIVTVQSTSVIARDKVFGHEVSGGRVFRPPRIR